MLRLGLALGVFGIATSGAMAAQGTFNGTLHLTSVNATCSAIGYTAGTFSRFRLSPPGLANNGTVTRLSSFYPGGFAETYKLASGTLIGTTYRTVEHTFVGRGGGQVTTQMRITSQVPAVPTATTTEIRIVGNIKNFNAEPGCHIAFIGNGFKE